MPGFGNEQERVFVCEFSGLGEASPDRPPALPADPPSRLPPDSDARSCSSASAARVRAAAASVSAVTVSRGASYAFQRCRNLCASPPRQGEEESPRVSAPRIATKRCEQRSRALPTCRSSATSAPTIVMCLLLSVGW